MPQRGRSRSGYALTVGRLGSPIRVEELDGFHSDLTRAVSFVLDVAASRRGVGVADEEGDVFEIERAGRKRVGHD
jgi:hypothetical protein